MKALLKKIEEHGMNAYITFETSLWNVPEFPKGFLDVQVKRWKSPRSREALNYFWAIVTEIANVLQTDKNDLYTQLVNDYGEWEKDENNQIIEVPLRKDVDPASVCGDGLYLYRTTYTIHDGEFVIYYKVKRPSDYNTQEFARFLDKVKDEARGLGIDI